MAISEFENFYKSIGVYLEGYMTIDYTQLNNSWLNPPGTSLFSNDWSNNPFMSNTSFSSNQNPNVDIVARNNAILKSKVKPLQKDAYIGTNKTNIVNNSRNRVNRSKSNVNSQQDSIWSKIFTKRNIITAVLAVGTVIGVTKGVNKNINGIWKLGEKVDGFLKNNKTYNTAANYIKRLLEKNPLKKSSLWQDIANVTAKENRIQPKWQMAKLSVLGPRGIFSLSSPDILTSIGKACEKDKGKFVEYLTNLLGKDAKICGKGIEEIAQCCIKGESLGDSFKVSNELLKTIKTNHNLTSPEKLLNFFDELQAGKIGSKTFEFAKDVKVKGWIPFSKGNLGDSLKKYAIMNGEGASTTLGKFTQQAPIILGESISNCINDRQLFGVALGAATLPSIFNNAQDAPTGQKTRTVLSEFISTAASWAIGLAGAGAIVYSAASLRNLKSVGLLADALRKIGKFAGLGLEKDCGKIKGFCGGLLLRLPLIFYINSKISKPIDNFVKKLFGMPTDEEKERIEQAKQQQMQYNYMA